MGYIGFDKETFAAFRGNNRSGPIHMLNLIRLKEQASLSGWSEGNWS